MGLAGLSFAAGLGAGYFNQSRYQDRQDQIAREQALRDEEFAMRKAVAEEALAERKQASEFRRAIGAASKDADLKQSTTLDTGDGARVYDMPSGVDSQDVASSDARQFRRNAESTGVDVAAPVVSSATTVNGKAYDSYAAGLRAAAEHNDPAAKAQRVAAAMEAFGRPDAAMDYRAKAEKFRNDLYEAQRSALFQKGADLIAGKSYAGFADAYNQHYKDGRRALWMPSGAGGTYVIQDEKTNAEVARIPMTGDANEDIMTWQRLVYPDKAAAAAADSKREQNKPYTLKPGEQRFRDGRLVTENTNRTAADARVEAAGFGRGGSGRTGGSGAPGDSDVDAALKAVYSGSDMKSATPEVSAAVNTWAHAIYRANGGKVPAPLAVQAALVVAQKPDAEQPVVNTETGTIDMAVQTGMGPVVTRPNHSAGLGKEKMRELVSGLQKKMPAEEFETLRDIAFDRSGQSFRRYLDGRARFHADQVAKNPAYNKLPPDVIASAVARAVKDDEVVQQRLASLLSQYATDLGVGLEFDAGARKPTQKKKAPVAAGIPARGQSDWRIDPDEFPHASRYQPSED